MLMSPFTTSTAIFRSAILVSNSSYFCILLHLLAHFLLPRNFQVDIFFSFGRVLSVLVIFLLSLSRDLGFPEFRVTFTGTFPNCSPIFKSIYFFGYGGHSLLTVSNFFKVIQGQRSRSRSMHKVEFPIGLP